MEQDSRALQLVELIYAGAIDPSAWGPFVQRLSELCGGAAVALSVQLPSGPPLAYHTVGTLEAFTEIAEKYLAQGGMPWGAFIDDQFKGRFALASENFDDADLPNTSFYQEVMKPQGLAPSAPIFHVIASHPDRPTSGMGIWRKEGGRPFTDEDLALCNRLVPHLGRAFEIHSRFGDVRNQRGALADVIDRLPLGIVLIDAASQPVVVNRVAEQIAGEHDGFTLGPGGPRAADSREGRLLRGHLGEAITLGLTSGQGRNAVMSVSRPSGRRAYTVVVAPLLRPIDGRSTRDAVAVVFVADPEATGISTIKFLQTLYSLTHAEAELVVLLASGRSLEEAAAERGVAINTIRSQLKQVFAKTETNRQGQLLRLVLTGVAGIQDESDFE